MGFFAIRLGLPRALRATGVAALCVLSGCTLIQREKGYPGGNVGYVADRQFFAKGHEQRVARYVIAMALIAPLMAETAETPIEAKLSAARLDAMYGRLARLLVAADNCALRQSTNGQIYGTCALESTTAAQTDVSVIAESAYSFETLSLDVSLSLFKATEQITDSLGIRTGVSNVLQANRLDPSKLLQAVIGLRKILPTVMKYYATYRDVAVILGTSVLDSCVGNSDPSCEAVATAYNGLLDRGKPVRGTVAPIEALFDASYARIDEGADWTLDKDHYLGLMYHIERTCFILLQVQQQDAGLNAPEDCRAGQGRGTGANTFYEEIKSR